MCVCDVENTNVMEKSHHHDILYSDHLCLACMRIQTRDAIDKAIEEDPSIFEYDTIYDDLTAKKRQTDQKVQNQVDRKV